MRNISELSKLYGQGDNSTTDRMWYEDAVDLCLELENYIYVYGQTPVWSENRPAAEEAIYQQLCNSTKTVDIEFRTLADTIRRRLISLGTALTSRISIEYVRQQIEQAVNKKQKTT